MTLRFQAFLVAVILTASAAVAVAAVQAETYSTAAKGNRLDWAGSSGTAAVSIASPEDGLTIVTLTR